MYRNIVIANKGVILFMVLSILLITVLLANVVVMLLSSQYRLTHHQVSRIQAYYAAQAGMNYAIEKLRSGNDPVNWPATGSYTHCLCRLSSNDPCCDIIDPNLPLSIKYVNITVDNPLSGTNNTRKINISVDYTYPYIPHNPLYP